MKRWSWIALSIVILAVFAGCAKAPDAQLKQAEDALAAAEAAGAPRYVPDAWDRAKLAADRLKAEVEKQGKRFALFRGYGKAKSMAEETVRLSEQAVTEANSRKTQLRGEVTAMIAEIEGALQSARSQLSRYSRVRGLDAASLRSSLNAAGRQLEQARSELSSGAYDRAMAVAAQARDAVNGVFKAIEKATGVPVSRKR